MELVCPLCNGLTNFTSSCPLCGSVMEDRGALEDFYGPYSPYQDLDSIRMTAMPEEAGPGECIHLVSCPECGQDTRIPVNRIPV